MLIKFISLDQPGKYDVRFTYILSDVLKIEIICYVFAMFCSVCILNLYNKPSRIVILENGFS